MSPPNNSDRKPTMMENVQTVNSAARTMLMFAVASVVGLGGWAGYSNYLLPGIEGKQAQEDLVALQEQFESVSEANKSLEATNNVLSSKNDVLQTSLKLLKVDQRVAQLRVDKKGVDEDGQKFLEVSFSEMDEEGNVIGSTREFTLKGHMFFVDCWVAKFEDRYIEQADPLRSANIFTFKSIYGDEMRPVDAFPLDDVSKPMGIYADSAASQFERQIWADFTSVCNDKSKQQELGIRAAFGQANYLPPEEGKTYQITIRSSGSVSLEPLDVEEN